VAACCAAAAARPSDLTAIANHPQIILGIGKGIGCVAGTIQDYMLGKKAEQGVWSYSDLIELDRRQRCCWYPCGGCCFYACCCCVTKRCG
jgi:hypothetical protein